MPTKWDETYPAISQIWLRHWENIIPIFDYPMDIRRVIYTTNAIKSVNRSLRKVIKTKAVFPDEESVFKLMYLALNNISKRWTRPIKNWKAATSHFCYSVSRTLQTLNRKRLHKNQNTLDLDKI